MEYNEREIKVVIGASYGDEGKGLMTDHFCQMAQAAGKRCLTVLHNGGAQRGHTVVSKTGARHVFHHLSSGTFSGSDTYLAKTFLINPMIFANEHSALFPDTTIYCSPRCRWSTPFDMIINQLIEDKRGSHRHGSCGYGIWETIVRHDSRNSLSFPEFMALSHDEKRAYLINIRDVYMPSRLKALGIDEIPEKWQKTVHHDGLIEHYIEDCTYFAKHAILADDNVLAQYPFVVFEGAQGLLLNQRFDEYEKFTTPSLTGAENPVNMISALSGNSDVEVCYITRTYLTRHGAGPFTGECPKEVINANMIDQTNAPNNYQGTLRYGLIDVNNLRHRIMHDFAKFEGTDHARLSLAVTHMNETDGKLVATDGAVSPEAIGIDTIYLSADERGVSP